MSYLKVIQVDKKSHEGNCVFITLDKGQIGELNKIRSLLDELWTKVRDQKKILDVEINPKLKVAFGTPDEPSKLSADEQEKKFKQMDEFMKTVNLQKDLAELEGKNAKIARDLNRFVQKSLKAGVYFEENFNKLLDKPADDAINELRRKIYIINSLIADVYADDPPCPVCTEKPGPHP